MKNKLPFFSVVIFSFLVLTACDKEDKRRPDVNLVSLDGLSSQVIIQAGEPSVLRVVAEDNKALSQLKVDIEPVGTEGINYFGDWPFSIVKNVDGDFADLTEGLTVPSDVRGSYQIVATAVDAQGLESEELLLNFEVENNLLPQLNFSGSIPAPEEDNVTIRVSIGGLLRLSYGVVDADGIEQATVQLLNASESVEYEKIHLAQGETSFAWQADSIFPASTVAANYTYKITATDVEGNEAEAIHPIIVFEE